MSNVHALVRAPFLVGAHESSPSSHSAAWLAQQNERSALLLEWDAADKPLTDEGREAAIGRAGALVERLMAAGRRDEAHCARQLMERLIAGRHPDYVLRIEQARGLV